MTYGPTREIWTGVDRGKNTSGDKSKNCEPLTEDNSLKMDIPFQNKLSYREKICTFCFWF